MFHPAAWLRLSLALLGACLTYSSAAQTIKLRNDTIHTPPRSAAAATAAPQGERAEPGSGLFLIQFEGPVQPAWTEALEALGVEFVRYVPDNTFVAKLENVPPGRVRAHDFVRWVGSYRAEHKLQKNVPK